MSRTIKTMALVLKKQNFSETDRILTVMSPDFGKKRVIVRAIRRPLSKLAGHLDTLMLSEIMLSGDGNLPVVTGAYLREPFTSIRSNLYLTEKAFAISRLVDRVLVEDAPQRPLYNLTIEALNRLNRATDWTVTWLFFLCRMTQIIGVDIGRFVCSNCGRLVQDEAVWNYSQRRLYCRDCRHLALTVGACDTASEATFDNSPVLALGKNSVKLLQILRRKPLSVLERVIISEDCAREVEEVYLREITDWFNRPWYDFRSVDR